MKTVTLFSIIAMLALGSCKKGNDPDAQTTDQLPDTRNDYVCFMDGSNLVRVDAKTGTKKWAYASGGGSSAPTVNNNLVFVGSSDNNLYAIDATTGLKKWAINTGDAVRACPTVANGVVYINSGRKLFALNASDGTDKWTYTFDQGTNFFVNSPIIYQGKVYITTLLNNNSGLEVIDAATGRGEYGYIINVTNFGSPTIAENGTIFWGSAQRLFAMTQNPYKEIGGPATFGTGAIYYGTSPTARQGSVYIGDRGGNFYSFNTTSGSQNWVFAAGGTFDRTSSPVVSDGLVFFANGTKLFAVNTATGKQKWELVFNTAQGHAVANGVLYVGNRDDKKLYAIDVQTGKTIWAIATDNGASKVCIVDLSRNVYHCGDSGSEP